MTDFDQGEEVPKWAMMNTGSIYRRRYGRISFWTVKAIMLIAAASWLISTSKEVGRQEILHMPIVQRVVGDSQFCYNGTVWPIKEFNSKKLTFKVKKEAP